MHGCGPPRNAVRFVVWKNRWMNFIDDATQPRPDTDPPAKVVREKWLDSTNESIVRTIQSQKQIGKNSVCDQKPIRRSNKVSWYPNPVLFVEALKSKPITQATMALTLFWRLSGTAGPITPWNMARGPGQNSGNCFQRSRYSLILRPRYPRPNLRYQ